MLNSLLSSVRIGVATMAICVGGYTAVVWAFAQSVSPFTANGSLLTDTAGKVIGSRQIAQAFTQDIYFWPRPSAADYDAAGAVGSNLDPAGPEIRERGTEMVARYGATAANPLPADLATASGAGLDPHISLAGALYQVDRVARARGLTPAHVANLVRKLAYRPGGGLTKDEIVNVLDLNIALDQK